MTHTKQALKRHRGLYMIILALCVALWVEPSVGIMTDMCRDLFHFLSERAGR